MNEKGQRYRFSDTTPDIRIPPDEKDLTRMNDATLQDIRLSTCHAKNHPAFPKKIRVADDALTKQLQKFFENEEDKDAFLF